MTIFSKKSKENTRTIPRAEAVTVPFETISRADSLITKHTIFVIYHGKIQYSYSVDPELEKRREKEDVECSNNNSLNMK